MKHQLSRPQDWKTLPSREFADWFNQLEGMRSPVAVGTRNAAGVANLAVFNSMTHVGARPPLLGLVFRPLTVDRHTYANLKASGVYTINHLPAQQVAALHQTSAKYPEGRSEFEATGLRELPSETVAPYVAEATISMQLRFVEEHHVAANDCVFVVGAVEEIRTADAVGFGESPLNWTALDGVVVSGLYNYYRVSKLGQHAYAKV